MDNSKLIKNFEGSATYQITVKGKVDPEFMKRLNDLSVSHTDSRNQILTTLIGQISDEAALNGLLNILFDNQFKVISVMKIDG